jgi:hypothetical protein
MRLADSFIGKDGKTLAPYINNSKIIEIVEISSSADMQRRIDEVKRAISKQSGTYLVAVFKSN